MIQPRLLFSLFFLLPLLTPSSASAGDGIFLGTLLGASLGGFIGNQIGHGDGRVAATAAGIVLGGTLGNRLGQDFDRRPSLTPERSSQPGGNRYTANSNHTYTPNYVAPDAYEETPVYRSGSPHPECRTLPKYRNNGISVEQSYDIVCLGSDGLWYRVP